MKTYPTAECPIDKIIFEKNRDWKVYCSDRCRKVAAKIRKEAKTPADIRAILARIEAKVDRIINGEREVKRESCSATSQPAGPAYEATPREATLTNSLKENQ